jgi:hypothetical protein
MVRLAASCRRWYWSRALLLGAALAAVVALSAAQVWDLRSDPRAAAVGPVALLVTVQVALVLAYLFARHVKLWLRSRNLPGWMRRAERSRLREAPLVAMIGTVASLLLSLVAPLIAPWNASTPVDASRDLVYRFSLPDRRDGPDLAEAVPLPLERPPDPAPAPSPRPAPPAPVVHLPPADPAPAPQDVPEELPERLAYAELRRAALPWLIEPSQEDAELGRLLRQGLPSAFDPDAVAAPHLATGVILSTVGGVTRLGGATPVAVDLDRDLIGEGATPSAEMSTEIALGRRDVLRIDLVGLYARAQGFDVGAMVGTSDVAKFSLWWEHAFFGVSHRFLGFERESLFDLSFGAGFAVDMLDAQILQRGRSSPLAESSEFGMAPAFSLSVGLWGSGPVGFTVDVTQSLPVNLSGQALLTTDVRAVMRWDLSETFTFFAGYRWLSSTLIHYGFALRPEERDVRAELQLAGPVVGLDIRF